MELFKIAFPNEESYQLSELSQSLQVDLNQAHSAYEDAKATALLFIKAIQKLMVFRLIPLNNFIIYLNR